jgi:hypothetical protein
MAGAGAGFHWMSLKAQRKSLGTRQDLKGGCEEADDYRLRQASTRHPSASSLVERLLLLLAMKFLEVLVLEKKELGLAEVWKAKDLVKG